MRAFLLSLGCLVLLSGVVSAHAPALSPPYGMALSPNTQLTPYCGIYYAADNLLIPLTNSDTFYLIKSTATQAILANGCSLCTQNVALNNGSIVINHAGEYRVSYTVAYEIDANNQYLYSGLFVNGNLKANAQTERLVTLGATILTSGTAANVYLGKGDIVDVRFKNETSSGKTVKFHKYSLNLDRISP